MWQTNPANGKEARCALTAKGIRYWQVIPRVFDYDAAGSYVDCPFAGPWFQWMRNLTVCYEAAGRGRQAAAFVLVYADGPGLPMAAGVRSDEWRRFLSRLQPGAIAVRPISYQALIALAIKAAPEDPTWVDLRAWVQRKIADVCATRLPAE